ncbi:MAG: hypothetical protein JW762_14315 [Dehalococcoidales bacterium]|nr:hypothetical protein [Dehalococcoidales bacterium]
MKSASKMFIFSGIIFLLVATIVTIATGEMAYFFAPGIALIIIGIVINKSDQKAR